MQLRQTTWVRWTQWPLAAAALAFLAAYAIEVLADPSGAVRVLCETVVKVTWAMFIVDYLVMLTTAERRGRWFVMHLLDLAVIVLPFLRPLRLLRLVQLFRVLQHTTGTAVRGRVTVYVVATTTLLVFVSALAVLDVEHRAPRARRVFRSGPVMRPRPGGGAPRPGRPPPPTTVPPERASSRSVTLCGGRS